MKNKILFTIIFLFLSLNSYSADSTKTKFVLTIGGGLTSSSFYKNDLGFTTSLGYYFKNNNYLGLLFNSTYHDYIATSDTELIKSELIGGGLSWRYRGWGNDKYYSVSPGIVMGFWKEDHMKSRYNSTYDYYYGGPTIVEHYYTGATVLTKIGYEKFFITMDNTLLIGNNVYHLFTLGIEFKNISLKTLWKIINILGWFKVSPVSTPL